MRHVSYDIFVEKQQHEITYLKNKIQFLKNLKVFEKKGLHNKETCLKY